jgi:NADPH:quinone reductase-like Zn-dependent oxidoreductase
LAALTAWQSLFDTAQLQPGQRVLIHAGSGGVGHFAVQLAKWKRAYVFATASTKNQDWLRELGVDKAIDHTHSSDSKRAARRSSVNRVTPTAKLSCESSNGNGTAQRKQGHAGKCS